VRGLVDDAGIRRFMQELGRAARRPGRVYLTGGATAALAGWRDATIDIDLKLVPDDDALLRAIPALKDSLQVNVELAAPIDFVPVQDGWEDRGRFITQEGRSPSTTSTWSRRRWQRSNADTRAIAVFPSF
jgi:hypothetical protein